MSLRKALSRRLGGGGGGDKSRAGAGASGSYGGDEGAGNDVDNEQEEDGCDDDDEGFSSRTSSFGGLTLRKTRTNASVTSSNGRGDEAVRERAIEKLRSLEPPQDPVEFALRALEPLMSYHAKNDSLTMQDLAEHHVPRYFSLHYVHQVNCHVLDLQGERRCRLRVTSAQSPSERSTQLFINCRLSRGTCADLGPVRPRAWLASHAQLT